MNSSDVHYKLIKLIGRFSWIPLSCSNLRIS